jgi:hypothetical protein
MVCTKQKQQQISEKLLSKYMAMCSGYGDTISC